MKLYYLDRKSYRQKYNVELLNNLRTKFGEFYILPEGGTNTYAVKGVKEFISKINVQYGYICSPCGTGGTLAGIIKGINKEKQALGFSVLKGGDFLIKNVKNLISENEFLKSRNWNINLEYHFGGYAKINSRLIDFIDLFEKENNIPLEPIYTGKMIYEIYDLILKDYFKKGETILAIHTGGLQGLEGMREKTGRLKDSQASN